MSGDMPCNLTCHDKHCKWNDGFGACLDNGVCEERMLNDRPEPWSDFDRE